MYGIGLKLGQDNSPASIVVVRAREQPVSGKSVLTTSQRKQMTFEVVWIEEFPVKTPYPKLVEAVSSLVNSDEIDEYRLIMDFGLVGKAVRELFRDVNITPVCLNLSHAGEVRVNPFGFDVPQADLISVLHVAFSFGRIKIAPGIENDEGHDLSTRLVNELTAFKASLSTSQAFKTAADQLSNLVVTTGIATWWLEQHSPLPIDEPREEQEYDVLRHGFF